MSFKNAFVFKSNSAVKPPATGVTPPATNDKPLDTIPEELPKEQPELPKEQPGKRGNAVEFDLSSDQAKPGKLKAARDQLFFDKYPDLKDVICEYRNNLPKKTEEKKKVKENRKQQRRDETVTEVEKFRNEIRAQTIQEIWAEANAVLSRPKPIPKPKKPPRRMNKSGKFF